MEKEKRIIYYTDELNEEFSGSKITPRVIDKDYDYFRNPFWDFCSALVQNVLTVPVKVLYCKWKFHQRYVGKEKLRECRDRGYFIYGNHTQPFADTLIPSMANFPKRNFFIVHPDNVSMPGVKTFVELCGALPIPCDIGGMKHFLRAIEDKIRKGQSVTIYPEAHIWPYYTGIRPFKAVSFQYPVKLDCPVYAMTNTYRKRGRSGSRADIVTYIDGPFYPDASLKPKDRQQDLRDRVYRCMEERSQESNIQVIEYRKKEETH